MRMKEPASDAALKFTADGVDDASIAMLDQEPVIAVAAAVLPVMSHPHQNPASLQFFTRKCEVQISFMERPFGIPTVFGRPEASVPEQDGTAPVFTLRDRPFE